MNTTHTSETIYAPDMNDREAMLDWLVQYHEPKIARDRFNLLSTEGMKKIVELEMKLLATVANDVH